MYFVEDKQHYDKTNTEHHNSWQDDTIEVVRRTRSTVEWGKRDDMVVEVYEENSIGYRCQQNCKCYFNNMNYFSTV